METYFTKQGLRLVHLALTIVYCLLLILAYTIEFITTSVCIDPPDFTKLFDKLYDLESNLSKQIESDR